MDDLLLGVDPAERYTTAKIPLPAGTTLEPLILTKTNARSTVHRPGYMDYIGVLSFDAKGKPVAEQRFLGLYTSSAYHRRPWEIPLVRERHDAGPEAERESGIPHRGGADHEVGEPRFLRRGKERRRVQIAPTPHPPRPPEDDPR